mmetsp:Transcript_17992/g.26966  ORF Transcript_17992/g.26966 Transcript_17992/m.26966 type:complete len:255 (+) Transcript_17992:93-857(+)
MGNSVGTLGWVIRNWKIDLDGKVHWVQLRHFTPSASFQVFVDGEETASERKLTKIEPIEFTIDGKGGKVIPSLGSYSQITKGFTYECTFGGEKVPELVFDSKDPKPIRPNLKAYLLQSAMIKRAGTKRVVFYKVEVTDTVDEKEEKYVLKKRFSDFEKLDHLIRCNFSGHHMASNLPAKPAKATKMFTDHLDKRFVQMRRNELAKYLSKLFGLPKVTANPDFAAFFRKPRKEDEFHVEDDEKAESKPSKTSKVD